jgi:hypothetical protein
MLQNICHHNELNRKIKKQQQSPWDVPVYAAPNLAGAAAASAPLCDLCPPSDYVSYSKDLPLAANNSD